MEKKYYEMVLDGPDDLIKGYLLGFLNEKGLEGEIVFERELHMKKETALDHIVRVIYDEDRFRIMIEENAGRQIIDSLANEKNLDIRVVSFRRITGAEFRVEFRVFSREMGIEYRKIFASLPEGVELPEYRREEKIHPDAKGIEAYAPEHEYELKAEGIVRGRAREVLDFYDRIEHLPFIKLSEIDIVLETGNG